MLGSDNILEMSQPSVSSDDKEFGRYNIHGRRGSFILGYDPNAFRIYRCEREKSRPGRNSPAVYRLSSGDKVIYTTKSTSPKQISPIKIFEGAVISKEAPYFLLSDKYHETFELRKGSPTGNSLFLLNQYQLSVQNEPKSINVEIYNPDNNDTVHFSNRKPVLSPNGEWHLDFGDRKSIPSFRNCILVEPLSGVAVIIVRKVDKDMFEIDVAIPVPELFIFAIALSMWFVLPEPK